VGTRVMEGGGVVRICGGNRHKEKVCFIWSRQRSWNDWPFICFLVGGRGNMRLYNSYIKACLVGSQLWT